MQPKLCKWEKESCEDERVNYPGKSIRSPYCKLHLAISHIYKKRKEAIKVKSAEIKQSKKEFAIKKEASRSKSYFEKKLETEVNAIVRFIDTGKGCISCNHGWESNFTRQAHAGHRISVGSNPSLRYHLFDIFLQCSICNNWKSANEREYDKGIIKHYGQETLDYIKQLPSEVGSIHLSIDELKQAIINARKVKAEILSGTDYSREEINNLIGIYK